MCANYHIRLYVLQSAPTFIVLLVVLWSGRAARSKSTAAESKIFPTSIHSHGTRNNQPLSGEMS
jgi:hypothetical protein